MVFLFIFQWVNRKVVFYNFATNYTQIVKEPIDDNVILVETRYDYDRERNPEDELYYNYFSPVLIGNDTISFISAQSTETIRYDTWFLPLRHDYKNNYFTIQNINLKSLPIGTTIVDAESTDFPYLFLEEAETKTEVFELEKEFKGRELFFFSYDGMYAYGGWGDATGEPYMKLRVSAKDREAYVSYPYKYLYVSLLDGSFTYIPDNPPLTSIVVSKANEVKKIENSYFKDATYSVDQKQAVVRCFLSDVEKMLLTNVTLLEKFPSLEKTIEDLNSDDSIELTFIINNIETADQIYSLFKEIS